MSVTIEIFPAIDCRGLAELVKNQEVFTSVFKDIAYPYFELRDTSNDTIVRDNDNWKYAWVESEYSAGLHLYKIEKDPNFTSEDMLDGLDLSDHSTEEVQLFLSRFEQVNYTLQLESKMVRHEQELKMLAVMAIAIAHACSGFISIVEPFEFELPDKLYNPDSFLREMQRHGVV